MSKQGDRSEPSSERTRWAEVPVGQDRIWDYFQTEAPEAFAGSRGRLGFLARRVRGLGRVLNIGVGGGEFEEIALSLGIEVYSLDPSEDTIVALRNRLGMGDRARHGYGQEIPFEADFFGAVVISEVFEHLPADTIDAILRDVRRVLRPGGLLVGTVPARENLTEQTVVCPCCGEVFHRWGHLQQFDGERVRAVLSPHLTVLEVKERPFVTWGSLNWKGKALAITKGALYRMGMHGSGEKVYFVGEKR
ncbi:hypothetical protein BH23GEM6_BH23GEM6_22550 [soil metagenome]